jgi:hypothetical protein
MKTRPSSVLIRSSSRQWILAGEALGGSVSGTSCKDGEGVAVARSRSRSG